MKGTCAIISPSLDLIGSGSRFLHDPPDTAHLQEQLAGQLDRKLLQQAHFVNGSQNAQHHGRSSKLILPP